MHVGFHVELQRVESPVATDENAEASSGSTIETASTSKSEGTLSRSDSNTSASNSAPSEPSSGHTQTSAEATTSLTSTASSSGASTALSETGSTSATEGLTGVDASAGSATSGADSNASASTSGAASTNVDSSSMGADSSEPKLPPIDDYSETGPFTTSVDTGVGPDSAYTVYRPETLGEDGFLHAPIIFGPGITQQVSVHTQMLTNFASHGFVVIGTPVLEGRPGDAGNLEKMQRGLDWILEQNAVPGIYEGKLWTDHAVSMGFSVGGTAAVQLGGDPSIATVVSIHGHTATAALHGTMFQTTGTQDNVGMPLQQDTFDASNVPTFLATLTGAPHQYIEGDGGGEERPVILAWMRYWIYGDAGGEAFFWRGLHGVSSSVGESTAKELGRGFRAVMTGAAADAER